jgi:hypothetical protein
LTTFFIPGLGTDERVVEQAYEEMRKQVALDMGRRPSGRRILSLWTRLGSVDCVLEVGRRDPSRGGTVAAIFDMGAHRPFVVWWQREDAARQDVREILGCTAYAVSEFDA